MKKILMVLVALLMVFSLVGCSKGGSSEPTSDEAETIRIGVVTTMNTAHGDYCIEGARLWADAVNENGGLLGKQVELVLEDNGSTNETYQAAFVKMVTENNVSAVYSNGYSDQVTLVNPDAEAAQIPFLAGNSSQACLNMGCDYYWMLRLSDAIVSPTMANACVNNLGMTKVAILQVNDSYGDGMADFVQDALEANGATVALRLSFDAEESQFNSYLAQVQDAGVDGIVGIAHQEQAALIMMQVAAAEIDVPLMGCSQFATAVAIETAGESANGWYSLADWTNEAPTESGKAFVEAYRAKWNRDPDIQSVCAYDGMLLLEQAIKTAGSADPVAINAALHQTNGLVGAMTTYTASEHPTQGHCLGQSIFMTQTVGGQGQVQGVTQR